MWLTKLDLLMVKGQTHVSVPWQLEIQSLEVGNGYQPQARSVKTEFKVVAQGIVKLF